MQIYVIPDVCNTRVYSNRHRNTCVSVREDSPRNARSFRALLRFRSPAAASVLCCHAPHRGHTWPVSRVNSSFSRVFFRGLGALGALWQHQLTRHYQAFAPSRSRAGAAAASRCIVQNISPVQPSRQRLRTPLAACSCSGIRH